MKNMVSILAFSLLLGACGGGGNKDNSTPTSPAVSSATIIQADEQIRIGQSTELLLLAANGNISNIEWRQTSGTPLTFYAASSKVIGFTAIVAGHYSFSVSFVDANNQTQSLSHEFSVIQEKALLTARLGHAVVEGNGVSLISYINQDENSDTIAPETLSWQQIAGPSVSYTDSSTTGKVAVFFDAPPVNKDTVLQFTVTGEANGNHYSDTIAILVEHSPVAVATGNNAPFTDRKAKVFLYNNDSPAGEKLIDCVYSNKASYANSCTFSQTPLIAQVTTSPTVDDIMDRVIVSHRWMGEQFKKFLTEYDNEHHDFKNLLRATTAIVIAYDVRPSFYHPYTGAIYLDPSDLWETPEQRDTINQAPDYRAAFGSELQFEMPWRYVKNNQYANYYSPLRYRLSRTLSSTLYDFASLLYHELAHANDFFPSTNWHTHNKNSSLLTIVNKIYNDKEIQSDHLQRALPLDPLYPSGENELTKLAQVRFHGQNASREQQALSPDDIVSLFKSEPAPQFYSYSSTREDYAILFDGFMMQARYSVLRDVAVSDQDYQQIFWGQRGRIGESWIKPRVSYVTARILPELPLLPELIAALEPPTALDITKGWQGSLVIEESSQDFPRNLVQASKNQSQLPDPRLLPKDGSNHHKDARRFIY